MHPSYYHQAHACILVFDATRKTTYKNLANWYAEMRQHRPHIPCVCGVNKIDGDSFNPPPSLLQTCNFATCPKVMPFLFFFVCAENMDVTRKSFAFFTKNGLPLHYVSASDGTNVVSVGGVKNKNRCC